MQNNGTLNFQSIFLKAFWWHGTFNKKLENINPNNQYFCSFSTDERKVRQGKISEFFLLDILKTGFSGYILLTDQIS